MRVCIIGYGLSAITLAKALVNLNIFVELVPPKKNYKINKSRTIGISKSNVNFFNKNIINIEKIIWKLNKIEIYSDNLKNGKILNFENNDEQLFSIVKNFEIFRIVNKGLAKNKYFKIIKPKKKLTNFKEYDLIINLDYNSDFTKRFFNKKIQKTYDSLAYTTIINHEKILNNVAIQIFTKKGPLAFLPISNYKTSIVYSIHDRKNYNSVDIKELINQYNLKYKIKKIENIESFELKSFILRSFYHDKILAFGDLLHRIHPLAGQGFNMTIRDIIILIDIINEKKELGLPLDHSINKEFEKRLRHKNYIFFNGVDLIHEFFNVERKLNNDILSKSIKLLGKNPYLNRLFTQIADKGLNF